LAELDLTMTDSILELDALRRVFPGFELGPVSLRLRPGQVYGLLGPNGAGKTTLLNLITLQLKATGGALRHQGEPIRWGDNRWKARLSYIRETPSFYDELTVAQTLALASRLYDRWDPLLADTLQRTLRDLIQDHPALCVLLSSHIFEDLEEAATDVLILRRGHLVLHATVDALRDSTLYRTEAAGTLGASPDLVLRWRRQETEWLLVHCGSPLDADLRGRPGLTQEHPASLIAAVYHGTEHADVD
jgi:ABC-type multidrug transport system ATPase subunit